MNELTMTQQVEGVQIKIMVPEDHRLKLSTIA